MALVAPSLSFLVLRRLAFLSLLFCCYALQRPAAICLSERYIKFNSERMNDSSSWHQSNMIEQILNYMMIRGLTCSLHKSSTSSYCSQICSPLAYTLTRVYLHSRDVMTKCQRPLCSQPFLLARSRVPPCGAILFSSHTALRLEMPKVMLEVAIPTYLELNITIWKVTSKRDPLVKPNCKNSASLAVWEWDSSAVRFSRVSRFCGNTSIQNIASPVQKIYLIWMTGFPHEKGASICLSYQSTAIAYARRYSPPYSWLPLVNYFKDELIDRDFIVGMSRLTLISQRRHGIWNISNLFKPFVTYIFDKNMLYSYSAGSVLHRVWSITGSVYFVPQFALGNFSCTANNDNSIKRPTLEIFDHPLTHYDVIRQIQPYVLEPPITCNTAVPSLLYNSSIGDLSLVLTTTIDYDAKISGIVRYIALSCPGKYCEKTVKTISASKGNIFRMTSHRGNAQQCLLIERSDKTGFIAISNFSVRIHGLTHMPCYYGGLFIYELEPLTIIAKICTPWVAKAWHHAVKRVNGTNGIFFNTRPVLFVMKSYGENFAVHLEGYAGISQCSGMVNAAFRDVDSTSKVSQGGEVMWFQPHRYAVRHENGCFQLSHIATDGEYLTSDRTIQLMIYASTDTFGNVANHTIEASVNSDLEILLNNEIVRSDYQNSTIVFRGQGMLNRVLPCRIFEVDLGLPDTDPFKRNDSYVMSLLPGRRSYSVGFSAQCLVLGMNPVVTMEYLSTLMHSCLRSEEMKRGVRMFIPVLGPNENVVTFPSVICGNYAFYKRAELSVKTLIIFNKPSFNPVCCVLDLDVYVSKGHLSMIKSISILEHDLGFTGFLLTSNRIVHHSEAINFTDIHRLFNHFLNFNLYDMLYQERLYALGSEYLKLHGLEHVWTFSSSANGHENSSVNVRVTGRPWCVNTMTADSALFQIETNDGSLYPRINISFRFRQWHSAADIHQIPRFEPKWNVTKPSNWKLAYSYCFTAYICYDFYRKQLASWLDGEQFCRSEGKVLLSTPTDYEWDIITTLFARDPYVIDLATTNSLTFINLLKNKVCFLGDVNVCSQLL